jgi:hypothetical protein
MAKFTSNVPINTRWRNNDFSGDAGSTHTFPDAFYDEFLIDWKEQLDNGNLVITETPTTGNIQVSSLTVGDITLTGTALGFPAAPTITGTSPINVVTASGTSTVSLNANYQTAGTYVTSVTGTSPITTSGTTAITVGIDQAAITAGNASSAQATVYLVRNNTASTILKGTLVSATGAEPSGRIDIAPFSVTGLQDSELRVMGIATENIGVGVNGIVMSFGTLTGLDTRGTAASALAVGDEDWDEGTILYAHPTVPGKLTEVRPQHDLAIAFTTVRHGSTGQIAIRIVPGNFHLEWLHDVSADNPSDGDIIQYKTSSSLWTKDSISGAGIAATVHTHGTTDVTSGNFVSTVTAGTGVTVTGGTGNASTPSVAIGQAVETTSNVTFNDVTLTARIKHASQLTFGVAATDAASVISSGFYMPSGKTIKFEGTTDDGFETDLTVVNPTTDNTISLPDLTGTVALTSQIPPTGSVVMWMTGTAPSGWLFLDGSTVSQATYPALAAVFGVVSGTFNLPDMRDRFVAGRAATVDGWANNAGTFAPNTGNIHTHTTNIAHGHSDTIAVSTHGDHTHTTDPAATTSGTASSSAGGFNFTYATGSTVGHTHSTNIAATASGAENTNLTHSVTGGVTSLGTTSVTSSNGTISPKSTLVNFIIKT